MSEYERNELDPCVIIKKCDNTSDSDEPIMLDATSKQFSKIHGKDETGVVVSSIPSNPNERNDEFQANLKSENSTVTRPKTKCATITSTIKLVTDVDIRSTVNKIHWFGKYEVWVLLVAAVFLAIATICLIHNYFLTHTRNHEKQLNDSAGKYEYSPDNNLTTVELQFNFKFRIISRSEWQGEKPKSHLKNLRLPSSRIIIAHTATRSCLTRELCSSILRAMQNYHFQRGWSDISYNFLVGGDGSAYIGRGWNKKGSHSGRHNYKSICIAFIGTFTDIIPPQRQITAAQKLIKQGLRLKKLAPDYRLYGHRQVLQTESPGEALYTNIKEWEHYSQVVV